MASSGMGSTKEVVVELKLMSGDAVQNIQALNTQIGKIKAELKAMKDAGQENSEEYIKLSQVLKEMNNTVKQNEKVLIENIREQKSNGDSLNAMRAHLKTLRAEYEDLSKAQRESSIGSKMLKDINDLTNEIKKAEEAQQDWSRSVGNYGVVGQTARQALREMKMECQNLAVALQTTNGKIQAQTQIVQSLANTIGTNTQEYKDAVAELNRLNQAYATTSEQLTAIEQKTGELSDVLADSNKRIQSFANDEQQIAAMQDGVNVLTSAYTLLQGSLKAVGVESKSLLEVYAKIQIVQQSMNSLMTIYKALNKDSNLMIMARVKLEQARLVWTRAYNAALAAQNGAVVANTTTTTENTVATTANTAATVAETAAESAAIPVTFSLTAAIAALNTVIKSNPFLAIASGIIMAIGGIVTAVKKLTKANKEAEEETKRLREEDEKLTQSMRDGIKERASAMATTTSKYDEQIAKIKALQAAMKSEVTSYKQKKEALDELNRIVPEYNGKILETGEIIEGNTASLERYIMQLEAKARAEGYADLLVEEYKKEAEIQREILQLYEERKKYSDVVIAWEDPTGTWQKPNWDEYKEATENIRRLATVEGELNQQLVEQQNNISTLTDMALSYGAVGSFIDTSKTTKKDKSDTKGDNEKNEIENAKKMYADLQKAAREYYESINRLHADALQKRINEENDRYMKEFDTLTTAYTNAIDLSLKGDDFLKKAGIDPEALQRYIIELSNAMDEATHRNKENVKKIKQDWEDALKKVGNDIDAAYAKLISKLDYEIGKSEASGISALRLELDHELQLLDEQLQSELAAKEWSEEQKTEITKRYAKKREKIVKDEAKAEKMYWVQQTITTLDAMSQVTGAFSDLFSTLSENDEKYQKYANALALVDIMVSMAQGIATAVAEGIKMGWPAAAVMIPIGIATVVSGISSAIALFNKNNKIGSAPKYAHGGPVKGAGTGTSDSIPAYLSNGEYVIREKVVKEYGEDFFDKINFGLRKPVIDGIHFATGGLATTLATPTLNVDSAVNYDLMRDVMVDAMSEIQPVVSVKEITHAQKRVRVKEMIAKQ